MYELFEHTADLGLRVAAPDRAELFREAARGLFAIIVEEIPHGAGGERLEFEITGERDDWLLFDWLNELLYVFETRHLLLHDFRVDLHESGLCGSALAEPLDRARHRLLHEVKAITYHGLRVESGETGWVAELIVDI